MNLRVLLNFGAFQICWFGCVLSAAYSVPLWSLALAISVVALHLAFTKYWKQELKSVLLVAALGCICELGLGFGGWIHLEGHSPPDAVFALWFLAFWLNFATVLNVSLSWLHSRTKLAVLFGVLGGPPAYYGAQQLGALELRTPLWETLVILAIYWGIACPVVLNLARRINPQENASEPDLALEGSTT